MAGIWISGAVIITSVISIMVIRWWPVRRPPSASPSDPRVRCWRQHVKGRRSIRHPRGHRHRSIPPRHSRPVEPDKP